MNTGIYILLFLTGAVAGLVDAIAGGGGLITIPVLMSAGIPPGMVLGTNKLQASFGSFTATQHYARQGLVDVRDGVPGIVATAIGAALGAWAVQQISPDFLNKAIPILLVVVAVYSLLTPSFGHTDGNARMSRVAFQSVFGIALGFYDGFFGPGTGSFWAVGFVTLLGMNLMRATGYTKLMNFASNVVSLAVFLIGGNVIFGAALCMAGGQIIGSRVGAGMAIRRGAKFIRLLFIVVVFALAAKLIWTKWFA